MSEQQQANTSNGSTEQGGLDRRKFLLRTTAVTAGAWAAPSILTIDRAFGHDTGSPHPHPECECSPNTKTDAATVKGLLFIALTGTTIPIRQNACLNDDNLGVGPVTLPGTLGTVEVGDASCENCQAVVRVERANLLVGATVITAEALHANAECTCEKAPSGGSQVYKVQVGAIGPLSSTAFQEIPLPGAGNYVRLNESPAEGADPGEFNAVHIFFKDPLGDVVDLKLASAKVTCA